MAPKRAMVLTLRISVLELSPEDLLKEGQPDNMHVIFSVPVVHEYTSARSVYLGVVD